MAKAKTKGLPTRAEFRKTAALYTAAVVWAIVLSGVYRALLYLWPREEMWAIAAFYVLVFVGCVLIVLGALVALLLTMAVWADAVDFLYDLWYPDLEGAPVAEVCGGESNTRSRDAGALLRAVSDY